MKTKKLIPRLKLNLQVTCLEKHNKLVVKYLKIIFPVSPLFQAEVKLLLLNVFHLKLKFHLFERCIFKFISKQQLCSF